MGLGRKLAAAALVALASLALAGAAGAGAPGTPPDVDRHMDVSGERCGQIDFEPHTDNVAAGITAADLGCRGVRRAVRRFHARGVSPSGFECREREHHQVLNHTDHRCRDGARGFSWQKY